MLYVVTDYDDTLKIVDTNTRAILATITIPDIVGITTIPDGSLLYVGSRSPKDAVNVLSTTTNTIIATITVPSSTIDLDASPIQDVVYAANNTVDSMVVIDTNSQLIIATVTLSMPAPSVKVNNAGDFIYSTTGDPTAGAVVVIDSSSLVIIATITVGSEPTDSAFTLDDSLYYVVNRNEDVSVINTSTKTVIATLDFGGTFFPNPIGVSAEQIPPPPPPPPSPTIGFALSVATQRNDFLTQEEILNVLSWGPTIGETVTEYAIYRDAALTDLVATIPQTEPHTFVDHNLLPNTAYTYFVIARNGDTVVGEASASVTTRGG